MLWADGTVCDFDASFSAAYRMDLQIVGLKARLHVPDFVIPFDAKQATYEVRQSLKPLEPAVTTVRWSGGGGRRSLEGGCVVLSEVCWSEVATGLRSAQQR